MSSRWEWKKKGPRGQKITALSLAKRVGATQEMQKNARLRRFLTNIAQPAKGLTIPTKKELGFNQGYISASDVSTVGTMAAIAQPAQGTAYNQRVGDRIKPMQLYGNVLMTVGDHSNVCRFILFQWFPDNNFDAPSMANDIFSQGASMNWMSPFIQDPRKRRKFRVLVDIIRPTAYYGGPGQALVKFNIPASRMAPIQFTPASATTGEGFIYYIEVSDSGVATHPKMSFAFNYKWADI